MRHSGAPGADAQQHVLMVAQGRELEWLFASGEGQWAVAEDCMAQRVILVALGRGHAYQGVTSVNKELSPLVCNPLVCRLPSWLFHSCPTSHPYVCHEQWVLVDSRCSVRAVIVHPVGMPWLEVHYLRQCTFSRALHLCHSTEQCQAPGLPMLRPRIAHGIPIEVVGYCNRCATLHR